MLEPLPSGSKTLPMHHLELVTLRMLRVERGERALARVGEHPPGRSLLRIEINGKASSNAGEYWLLHGGASGTTCRGIP